jgi:hypothetical protein
MMWRPACAAGCWSQIIVLGCKPVGAAERLKYEMKVIVDMEENKLTRFLESFTICMLLNCCEEKRYARAYLRS